MELQNAIEKSKQWVIQSSVLTDGLEIDASLRSRVAASLFHLFIEHQQAVHMLTSHELSGSAFALLRLQLEAYVRGAWYQRCATDTQLADFVSGAQPPRISVLLNDLGSASDFDSQHLLETKQAIWDVLNNFTHGGSIQVQARNDRDRDHQKLQDRTHHPHVALVIDIVIYGSCGHGDYCR